MQNTFIFLTTFLLSVFNSYAQPIATAANVPNTNESELYMTELPENFSPGASGANQIWDFSSLDIAPVGANTIVPVASTPYANAFANSNHCVHYSGPFGDSYHFYNLAQAKFEKTGTVFVGVFMEQFQNPRTYVTFPFTYGGSFVDTFQVDNDPEIGTVTATYDAYGTLILPYGTYNNVIRQKLVVNGQTDYIWYNSDPFIALVETSLADQSAGLTKLSLLATPEFLSDDTIVVFPNPVDGDFTVQLTHTTKADVSIYDASGRCVFSRNTTDEFNTFNATTFATGIYILKVTDANGGSFTKKIVKK